MAKLWIVMVLLLAQSVFCLGKHSCDTCIRAGRTWCHKKIHEGDDDNCILIMNDASCDDVEILPSITNNTNGDLFKPMFAERTLYLKDFDKRTTSITYASGKQRNITIDFLNIDNQDPKLIVDVGSTKCEDTACTVNILAKPLFEFCSFYEYVDIAVKVEGFKEHATIRYHVPCSCECSKHFEHNSAKCDYHGNYTCGVCTCESEWTGERCDTKCGRGDQMQDACLTIVDEGDDLVECYGNGECLCGNCVCFGGKPGSQYFDPKEQCADACIKTKKCSACLRNGTLGDCTDCPEDVTVVALNETIAKTQTDEKNRNTWVHCNEVANSCNLDYYTMKSEERFLVMLVSNCNNAVNDGHIAGAASTQVPLILGILGIVAVIAAVGGILLWKHMNAIPALPLTDPQYANIDAEDCTGENPLYKPPTSSFKNPTYGKW